MLIPWLIVTDAVYMLALSIRQPPPAPGNRSRPVRGVRGRMIGQRFSIYAAPPPHPRKLGERPVNFLLNRGY
jgi:hypothetical protein